MILGVLAERGPMHGHQIRRTAELPNAGVWGGITGGPDPVSVVLLFATGAGPVELNERLAERRRRLEAELRWHDELGRQLTAGRPGRSAMVRAAGQK